MKKYQKALNTCPNGKVENRNVFRKNMADCFICLGGQFHDQNNYEEAIKFYKKAHQKLIECYESNKTYRDLIKNTADEVAKIQFN